MIPIFDIENLYTTSHPGDNPTPIDLKYREFVKKYVVIKFSGWYYNDKYKGFNISNLSFRLKFNNQNERIIRANIEKNGT